MHTCSGTLPVSLVQLTAMEYLVLSLNSLHGTLADGLSGLSRLILLWTHVNEFTGTIPALSGSLDSLVGRCMTSCVWQAVYDKQCMCVCRQRCEQKWCTHMSDCTAYMQWAVLSRPTLFVVEEEYADADGDYTRVFSFCWVF